ncbi:MAG: hypothetical protein ACI3ZD_01690 [Prevotella sp.]
MKKTFKGVTVTMMTNDENESEGRRVMNGALSMSDDAKEAKFVESAPRPRRQRATKIVDGQLLSLTQNDRGQMRMHTKAVDPRDIPNYAFVLYCEATDAINKILIK